ncbi:IS4 family transposase [Haliea sp. AH-315-K21]|uniref:IS4 family transposase n=1 Tax=SAR86 cluster bacterium TaxID=2030880 RepID=A0A2A5CBL9_9GAMM|nr:IS4 family transposase [Haliea sp. AH-315-K21]PCJ41227.1 MAG: IS4 family transposase [SAR86 cluster bacterium]
MTNLIRNSSFTQQKSITKHSSKADCYSIFNLLTSDVLLDKVEALLPAHRERHFPPTETLAMFITQALSADRSCQNIVNQTALYRLTGGLRPCSVFTGGYCQARQRLPLTMVSELTRFLAEQIDAHVPNAWRWKGRQVRIVDRTTISMPDTVNNQSSYPQQANQAEGLGFPLCRVLGVTCLSSGALLNAAVGRYQGKGGDERTLLRSIQNMFQRGEIILGDALFATYFFMAEMQLKGVDLLMEQQGQRRKSTDFRKGQKLGVRDHLIILQKPKHRPQWMSESDYADAPACIQLREFKVSGKVMITTMLSPKIASKTELKLLYKKRWHVALDIRDIKEIMGMNILSCKTPEMIVKEIWVYLLAYNLIRLMMAQSVLLAGITPREISFKHCLQLWLSWRQQHLILDDKQLGLLFTIMAQQRVGKRPDRVEPRAVKRRPKPFPLLTKPRKIAKFEITARLN